MAHPMAIDNPYNAQFKAMLWRIKFYTDAATELVNGQGIDSIEEIKTLAQYHVTRLWSIIRKPQGRQTGILYPRLLEIHSTFWCIIVSIKTM